MNTAVKPLEDNTIEVTVTVDGKEVDSQIGRTYREFANKYNFPGFRKGKAPRPVIDNALGGSEAVLATVTEAVVNDAYPMVVEEEGLFPVGQPVFDKDMESVKAGEPYTFKFTLAVKPEVELSSYDPVEVELPQGGASDAEIEEQIDVLLDHYGTYEDAGGDEPVTADVSADLSMKATDASGNAIELLESATRLYTPGTGLLSAEFDEKIMGMKKGESRSFTLDVPADEAAILLQDQTGKTVSFEVTVNAVQKRVKPEFTDAWVKETLGLEDMADLRKNVAESMEKQKADIIPRIKENAVGAALAERYDGEAPEGMVEQEESTLLQDFFTQLQRQGVSFDAYLSAQGLTSDSFKEDVKLQAADNAKQQLALDAWARHKGITATPEEITEEFVKANVPDPAALEKEWRESGRLFLIREGIIRAKAMKDAMDTAVVTEKPYEPAK